MPLQSPVVRRVPVPADAFERTGLSHIDYADAYAAMLPARVSGDARDAFVAFVAAAPRWVDGLMSVRDRVVGVLGLKTSPPRPPAFTPPDVVPGALIGIFRVREASARSVLVGEDDRHLDFRVLLQTTPAGERTRLTVSTFVQFNRWYGRVYFAPVRLGHRMIVPAMLRSTVQRLASAPAAGKAVHARA